MGGLQPIRINYRNKNDFAFINETGLNVEMWEDMQYLQMFVKCLLMANKHSLDVWEKQSIYLQCHGDNKMLLRLYASVRNW